MGVGNNLLRNRVSTLGVCGLDAVAERVFRKALHAGDDEIAFLFVEERTIIADQVLEVAELRPIDGWKIDFGNDAVP